jgi:DNA-binding MarR family transcriptional regulator
MLPLWKYFDMEENMQSPEQMTDEFVGLVHRLFRLQPKLVFPDERVASMKQQLRNLGENSAGSHEDRVFLFRILDILIHSETPPTMGELSAQLGIPLSSATRMADGLVRANFVERCDDPHDRRVVRLCITKTGQQFIEMGMNFLRQRVLQLLNHFSPDEQAQLLRLMNKLIDSIQTERHDGHE